MSCHRTWVVLLAVAAIATSGCRALKDPPRARRCQEACAAMSARRDAAELLAARQQYEEGDFVEAQERLERLLARNPDHCEAQELLAEVRTVEKQEQRPVVSTSWVPEPALPGESAGERRKPRGDEKNGRAAKADNAQYAGVGKAGGVAALLDSAEAVLQEESENSTSAAMTKIRQAIAVSPHDPQIPISAAGMLLRHNQPEAAATILAGASDRFPNSAAVRRMLGTAYYRLGDYKRSQVAIQQALSLDKSSALSYFLMGCTLAKLGQAESAVAHFRQAEVLDPRYGIER